MTHGDPPVAERCGSPGEDAAWERLGAEPGLCRGCRHARLKASERSAFLRCALADLDPRFPRFPRLPVTACEGHEPAEPEGGISPA
jgi:hypothetical protein